MYVDIGLLIKHKKMNNYNLNINQDYKYQVGAWYDGSIMFESENSQLETISREDNFTPRDYDQSRVKSEDIVRTL